MGGTFIMGNDSKSGYSGDGEGPSREVGLNSFFIDTYAVTNEQFLSFIRDTSYVTEAEQYGWSFVFHSLISRSVAKSVSQAPQETQQSLFACNSGNLHDSHEKSNISKHIQHFS